MTPQEFIVRFREVFGETAPLPIALWYGITQSMSCKGNCLDNAVMENFFGNK